MACLEFHTKLNTLDEDVKNMLGEAVEEVETRDWRGLVVGNEAADFSVGANLAGGVGAGGFEAIERAVKGMQDALTAVRFCSKPVVTAPAGRTLGGGCEVSMAGARAAAAAETYMGLVEVGVGLIPGAGGCKELVRRVVSPPMRGGANAGTRSRSCSRRCKPSPRRRSRRAPPRRARTAISRTPTSS